MDNNEHGLTALIDMAQFTNDVQNAKNELEGLATHTRNTGNEAMNLSRLFGKAFSGLKDQLSTDMLKQFASEVIRVRGTFQDLEATMSTMLGSKEKATGLMSEITAMAAKTPFSVEEIAAGSTQLLAFGTEAGSITETLSRLGDIASGVSMPLGELISLYGTTLSQGQLYAQDLEKFTGSGIPMIGALASQLGIAETNVRSLVEQGKIGFPEVQAAIESLTGKGGIFYQMMESKSATLPGQIKNLNDAWNQMLNEIGQGTEGIASAGISGLTTLVNNYEQVGKVLISLITTYGVARTATIAYDVIKASDIALDYAKLVVTGKLEVAMKALNLTMLKNPYVAAIALVSTLVTMMWALHDSTTAAERAQKQYNNEKEAAAQAEGLHKQKIEQLLSTATDQSNAEAARVGALEELKKAYPQIFSNYDLEKLKLADILRIKKEIAETDNNAARIGRQTKLIMARKEAAELQSELDFRNNKGGQNHSKYIGKFTPTLQKRADDLNNLIPQYQKDVDRDNAGKVMANVGNLSNKDLSFQLNYLKKLTQGATKEMNYELKHGLFQGVFSTSELKGYLAYMDNEMDKRKNASKKSQDENKKALSENNKKPAVIEEETTLPASTESNTKPASDNVKEYLDREKASWKEYIKEYGSYNEKRAEIKKEYDEKIANPASLGDKAILEKQQAAALQTLDISMIQKTDLWKNLFSDASDHTIGFINKSIKETEQLRDYLNGVEGVEIPAGFSQEQIDALKNNSELVKTTLDQLARKRDELGKRNPFIGLIQGFEDLKNAGDDSEKQFKATKDIIGSMQAISSVIGQVGKSLESLGGKTGEVMGQISGVIGQAASMASMGASLGGVWGAAAGAAVGLATSLVSIFSKSKDNKKEQEIKRLQGEIDTLQTAYDNLGEAIEGAYSKDASDMIKQQSEMLEQQKLLIQNQMLEEQGKKNADNGKIEAYQKQIDQINDTISDNNVKAQDAIFGADVKSAIDEFAQAYTEAWASGNDKAQAMKDVVKNMIKGVITEMIKSDFAPTVQKIRDRIQEMLADGIISDYEQLELDKIIEAEASKADQKFSWADKYLKEEKEEDKKEEARKEGSSGRSFETMSQDSADELNGRFTALQMAGEEIKLQSVQQNALLLEMSVNMDTVKLYTQSIATGVSEMKDIALTSMNHLWGIEKNTRHLQFMREDLARIKDKVNYL